MAGVPGEGQHVQRPRGEGGWGALHESPWADITGPKGAGARMRERRELDRSREGLEFRQGFCLLLRWGGPYKQEDT